MDFTPFERNILEALNDCRGSVKQCAKNSISHLEKAWRIKEIDKEMAVFRAITAEEEASSSLFYSLKNHKYINSDKILFREHASKLGLFPFLQSIGGFLFSLLKQDSCPFEEYALKHSECNGRKAIELMLKLKGQDVVARPIPPLHFSVSHPDTQQVCTFEANFKELIVGVGYSDSLKYIKDVSRQRNKLLYADESGRPQISESIEDFLVYQKHKSLVILTIVLMSDPWMESDGHSAFIQQALDAYLLILARIHQEDVFQHHKKHTQQDNQKPHFL